MEWNCDTWTYAELVLSSHFTYRFIGNNFNFLFFCSSFAWSWCYCFVIFLFCLFSSSSLLSSLCGHCLLYWNLRVFVNRFQMKLFVDDAIIVGRRSGARACHTYMRAMQMLSNPPLIQLVIINRKPALSFWFKKTNFVNDPVLYVIC